MDRDKTAPSHDAPRDSGGFREDPAPQGLKEPPFLPPCDDSGEWTRGGGTDPNEIRKVEPREQDS
jgi:hypothetical protein